MITIHFRNLVYFSLVEDESVTLVPVKPLEIAEGNLIRVVRAKRPFFEGEVVHVWESGVGTQIIQASEVSVSQSGNDLLCAMIEEIRNMLTSLDLDDRSWVFDELSREFRKDVK